MKFGPLVFQIGSPTFGSLVFFTSLGVRHSAPIVTAFILSWPWALGAPLNGSSYQRRFICVQIQYDASDSFGWCWEISEIWLCTLPHSTFYNNRLLHTVI